MDPVAASPVRHRGSLRCEAVGPLAAGTAKGGCLMPTVASAFPVARKPHACMSCGCQIESGERYYRWVGTNDAWIGLAVLKECARCCKRYGRRIPEEMAA